MSAAFPDVCLVGHPFAPIGMGEQLRSSFRALRSVGVRPGLLDVYGGQHPEPAAVAEFGPFLETGFRTLNLFHINGDEIEPVLAHLAGRPSPARTWRAVLPLWELPHYPERWARLLEQFDEVWAASRFVEEAIAKVVQRPVVHLPPACEVVLSSFIGRRFFGIPEATYAFLFSFDLRSWATRKNPEAVVAAFRRAVHKRPHAPVTLVLKINGVELGDARYRAFLESLADLRDRLLVVPRTLTDDEMKNLVRCCDCYVSLHRSEGFGRGPAEAMALGKPVIATRWSGNLDFMNDGNSLLIDCALTPVAPDAYPFWQGQHWAEPDVEQAAAAMVELLDQPEKGVAIGRRASLDLRREFSFRAIGRRTVQLLERAMPSAAAKEPTVAVTPLERALSGIDEEIRSGHPLSPELLARIPLEVLGELYLGLRGEYRALLAALPSMAPAQVQRDWTGSDGPPLMEQSCAFVNAVVLAFQQQVGRPLGTGGVLDYGCGWGRLLRLMLRYAPAPQIWGLDPWDRSIDLCREHRIPVKLAVSDYLPKALPVGETRFELIYAFSVFTHLSPSCALQVMTTLREYLKPDGLLAITVRPKEYWRAHRPLPAGMTPEAMMVLHRDVGFAFIPHDRPPIDGDVTYGDASYSLEYIRRAWPGWEITGTASNALDPLQTIVYLRRAAD
jgi:glycosyltransferase involved in cell wall biosynthesis/SAM-dependent methyltransferase